MGGADPARWGAVDDYLAELLAPEDAALEAAIRASAEAGLPPHQVSALQGKLLQLLVQLQGARSVLEIGTLGGYSTIWLARGAGDDGRVVTLEANPKHAEVARGNLARAGVRDRVEVREGPALASLAALEAEGRGPFDFAFIDADKPNNPEYLRASLRLSRPGTVIVADNVVREGAVIDAGSADPSVQGLRRFLTQLAAEGRVSATALQTVGRKGHDGFALIRVLT